jgi:hypothetical protein
MKNSDADDGKFPRLGEKVFTLMMKHSCAYDETFPRL